MLRIPLLATPVVVVIVAVVVPLLSGEYVSVSIVAGLIAVVGAWCVPVAYSQGETGSLLTVGQDVWTPRLTRLKTVQVVTAGAVLVGLVGLELLDAVMAAVFGVAVALVLGAFTGTAAGASSSDANSTGSGADPTAPGGASTPPATRTPPAERALRPPVSLWPSRHLSSAPSPPAPASSRLRASMRHGTRCAQRGT